MITISTTFSFYSSCGYRAVTKPEVIARSFHSGCLAGFLVRSDFSTIFLVCRDGFLLNSRRLRGVIWLFVRSEDSQNSHFIELIFGPQEGGEKDRCRVIPRKSPLFLVSSAQVGNVDNPPVVREPLDSPGRGGPDKQREADHAHDACGNTSPPAHRLTVFPAPRPVRGLIDAPIS